MTKPGKRLLAPGYAKALRGIHDDVATTWFDLAELLKTDRMTAQRLLHGFHDVGLTRIVGYACPGSDGKSRTAVYALGAGPDAPHPGIPRRRKPSAPGIELLTFINAVKELMHASHCGKTLAEEVGYSPRTALDTLRTLKAVKLIHIDGFTVHASGGDGYPTYTWGPDKSDKPKRKPQEARALWLRGNQVKAKKRVQARILAAIVNATPIDRRAAAAREAKPARLAELQAA